MTTWLWGHDTCKEVQTLWVAHQDPSHLESTFLSIVVKQAGSKSLPTLAALMFVLHPPLLGFVWVIVSVAHSDYKPQTSNISFFITRTVHQGAKLSYLPRCHQHCSLLNVAKHHNFHSKLLIKQGHQCKTFENYTFINSGGASRHFEAIGWIKSVGLKRLAKSRYIISRKYHSVNTFTNQNFLEVEN